MRCAITRVLPEPAPARINRGPSPDLTASRCCSLSCERKSVMKLENTFKHTMCRAQTGLRLELIENRCRGNLVSPLFTRGLLTSNSVSLFLFKELNCMLVLLGGSAGIEGAEVAALASLRILLARIEPVLA